MARYTDIKTIEEMDALVSLQIGKALYAIDSTRPIFQEYKDLPSVGTEFTLLEAGNITTSGVGEYGSEIYLDEVSGLYYEDTVMKQQQTFTITAAYDSPSTYLQKFKLKRNSNDFWYTYFNSADIGVNSISNITDTSIPVDGGGEWEERRSLTITVNYLTKETVEGIDTVDKVEFGWEVAGEGDGVPIDGEGEAGL